MKTLLFTYLFVILTTSCLSQENANKILEDAVRSLKEPNTIIYIDSAMNFYGTLSSRAKKGEINGFLDTTKIILHLQKNEIRFLNKAFVKDTSFAWPANLFANSQITKLDSAKYFRLKFVKEMKELNKRYFHLSRIIYFRNNTFAVFRLAEMYDYSGGYDYLFFYQKIGGFWKQYMKVHMGAW